METIQEQRTRANKVTGANSRPALQFKSRWLRWCALVFEGHGRYHGGAAIPTFPIRIGLFCKYRKMRKRIAKVFTTRPCPALEPQSPAEAAEAAEASALPIKVAEPFLAWYILTFSILGHSPLGCARQSFEWPSFAQLWIWELGQAREILLAASMSHGGSMPKRK